MGCISVVQPIANKRWSAVLSFWSVVSFLHLTATPAGTVSKGEEKAQQGEHVWKPKRRHWPEKTKEKPVYVSGEKNKKSSSTDKETETKRREDTEGPLQDMLKSKEGRMLGMTSPFSFWMLCFIQSIFTMILFFWKSIENSLWRHYTSFWNQ